MMHILKVMSFVAFVLVGGFAQVVKADTTNTDTTKTDTPKLGTATLPTDKKSYQPISKPVGYHRRPGMVTIKPLIVNFSGITVGMKHKSQLINGITIDPFQSAMGRFTNQAQATGRSYDLELGVMLSNNIEAFVIAGFEYQRGFNKLSVANFIQVPFNPNNNFFYDFQSRTNYSFSLGGRYYWNTKKPWYPFVGLMGTVIRQAPIRAKAFLDVGFPIPVYAPIGSITLQDRKNLLGGTLQVGADYQFTDLISITFAAGVQYTQRTPLTYTSLNGQVITCRDNRNFWSFPFMAALKFTL